MITREKPTLQESKPTQKEKEFPTFSEALGSLLMDSDSWMETQKVPTEQTWRLCTQGRQDLRRNMMRRAELNKSNAKSSKSGNKKGKRAPIFPGPDLRKKKISRLNVIYHERTRVSGDPLQPDGRQLPVECLETVLVGDLVP